MSRSILIALLLSLALVACDEPSETDAGTTERDSGAQGTDAGPIGTDAGPIGTDAGPIGTDAGPMDAGPDGTDAGPVGTDAGPIETDAGPFDAGGPDAGPFADASVGTMCTYNRECDASQTCECNKIDGMCSCQPGARGTGAVGTACTTPGECTSGVCLSEEFCTDACTTAANCGGGLPECREQFFLGLSCAPAQ